MNQQTYKLFHNPHFLLYSFQPDQHRLVVPSRPVASIQVDLESKQSPLAQVYALSQHVQTYPWFFNERVVLHVRSTSVGDVIQAPDGQWYVVESFGFQPLATGEPATAEALVRAAYEKLNTAYERGLQDRAIQEETLVLLAQAIAILDHQPGAGG